MRWTKPLLDLKSLVERVHLPIFTRLFPMEHTFCQIRSIFVSLFLLSLPLPFVLTGGQRDILLLFCLLANVSLRIPWDVWTAQRVAEVIFRTFGVRNHRDHVARLLREAGWSRQQPIERATQRDEQAIKQWYEERWPAIKKKRKRKSTPLSG
jgi:hypothetical protein